jgi:hypothetical protein
MFINEVFDQEALPRNETMLLTVVSRGRSIAVNRAPSFGLVADVERRGLFTSDLRLVGPEHNLEVFLGYLADCKIPHYIEMSK